MAFKKVFRDPLTSSTKGSLTGNFSCNCQSTECSRICATPCCLSAASEMPHEIPYCHHHWITEQSGLRFFYVLKAMHRTLVLQYSFFQVPYMPPVFLLSNSLFCLHSHYINCTIFPGFIQQDYSLLFSVRIHTFTSSIKVFQASSCST